MFSCIDTQKRSSNYFLEDENEAVSPKWLNLSFPRFWSTFYCEYQSSKGRGRQKGHRCPSLSTLHAATPTNPDLPAEVPGESLGLRTN